MEITSPLGRAKLEPQGFVRGGGQRPEGSRGQKVPHQAGQTGKDDNAPANGASATSPGACGGILGQFPVVTRPFSAGNCCYCATTDANFAGNGPLAEFALGQEGTNFGKLFHRDHG